LCLQAESKHPLPQTKKHRSAATGVFILRQFAQACVYKPRASPPLPQTKNTAVKTTVSQIIPAVRPGLCLQPEGAPFQLPLRLVSTSREQAPLSKIVSAASRARPQTPKAYIRTPSGSRTQLCAADQTIFFIPRILPRSHAPISSTGCWRITRFTSIKR
jgi:hypothetical protein